MYFFLRNKEARSEALRKLDGKWGNLAVATLLYLCIYFFAQEIPSMIFSADSTLMQTELRQLANNDSEGMIAVLARYSQLLCLTTLMTIVISILLFPLEWGYTLMFLKNQREEQADINNLFDGYRDLGRFILTPLLVGIYIMLWSLLFVIPGIVKSYSYAMTPYVLRDNPGLTCNSAIEKSMAMMRGHKWELFCLHLSFIGWGFLAVCTCCIGFLWFLPYFHAAQAAFYDKLKAEAESEEAAPAEEQSEERDSHAIEGEYAQ